jgi:hypothetical protein
MFIINQINLFRIHQYYLYQIVDKKEYDKVLYFGTWGLITSLALIFSLVVGCYLMINFIPIKNNNCHGYNLNICIYGRFFAIVTMIVLIIICCMIVIGIILLLIGIITCCSGLYCNKKPKFTNTLTTNVNYESMTNNSV